MNGETRDVLILFGIAALIIGLRRALNQINLRRVPRCPSCGAEMILQEATAHHKRWACDCGESGANDYT